MKLQLYQNEWLQLSLEDRRRLAAQFNIKRSESVKLRATKMGASVMQSDGTSNKDLSALSFEAMKAFVGKDEIHHKVKDPFSYLLDLTLKKLYGNDGEAEEIISRPLAGGAKRPLEKAGVVQGAV